KPRAALHPSGVRLAPRGRRPPGGPLRNEGRTPPHPHGGRRPRPRPQAFPPRSTNREPGPAPAARPEGLCMRQWFARVSRALREDDGPTAVEYAVLLALIVVVCISAITALGTNAGSTFANVALNTAAGDKGS